MSVIHVNIMNYFITVIISIIFLLKRRKFHSKNVLLSINIFGYKYLLKYSNTYKMSIGEKFNNKREEKAGSEANSEK